MIILVLQNDKSVLVVIVNISHNYMDGSDRVDRKTRIHHRSIGSDIARSPGLPQPALTMPKY